MSAVITPVRPRGFLHDPKRLAIRVGVTVVVGAVLLYLPMYFPRFRVEGQFNVIITYALAALRLLT